MAGRTTWWRWLAGLMAVLLLASLGAASARAGAATCPDDVVAVGQAQDVAMLTASDSADDPCPEGCLACSHCQSHQAAASLPAGPSVAVERFARLEWRGRLSAAPLRSHLTDRLKRPPRA
jgi:hypothetical protein